MNGPLLLGIDTATDYLALSLVPAAGPAAGHGNAWHPDQPELARFVQDLGREHAARIVQEIAALLQGAGAERSDVAAIGVGVGPGSYTGVRIGVATAQALGRAWGVPVSGSSSLLALMGDDLAPGQRGVALLDARRGNVYALLARRLPGIYPNFEPLEAPLKLARQRVAERYAGLPQYEGAPDASILARRATSGGPLQAYYL